MTHINDTAADIAFVPVTKRLEKACSANPGRTAVICRNESVTYKEFNERVNRVANALLEKGLEKETIVAVMADRCIDAYVSEWAVLKAGGAFVFISPSYPEERVKFILEDSGAKYIITDELSAGRIQELSAVPSCEPLAVSGLKKHENAGDPDVVIEPGDLCYCIYTSGSTGRPKGVMIEHGNLANFVDPNPKNRETVGITDRAHVVLAIAALTFDFSLMEEFIPLSNGLTVVLATDEEIHDPLMLAELMEKNGVDCMMGTPSYFAMLLSVPQTKKALANIVSYDLGAEAFPGGLYKKLSAASPNAYIMNGYGPTEATISCTMKVVESDDDITIGVPSANVFAYIIGEDNTEVPEGELGELLICGAGVGRGYINLPEKTAEVFITFNGMRGYKTGDLARINSSGEIESHGRRDDQVKLRGLRIELGEIEEVLNSHPLVRNAAVTVYEDRWLCAYYTVQPGHENEIDDDKLRDHAAKRLAHYMVPDLFIRMDEMPLTDNHKINRKALPKPAIGAGSEGGAPKNNTQKQIFDIVAQVTGNDSFGIATPFVRAGLTSLGAMQLNVLLSEAFGRAIKTSDIFLYDTVEKMEGFILAEKEEALTAPAKDGVFPLTGSQEGIFAVCDKNPGSTLYNIPFLFTLGSGTDTDRLRDALIKTVAAHPYLNTVFFVAEDGALSQKQGDAASDIPVIKLSDSEFEAKRKELVRPFELQDQRMYRIEIYKTDSADYLFTDFHHILADGNSYDVFFEDLDRAYRGEELQTETFSGYDVAAEEAHERSRGRYKTAAQYYDSVFSGLETESLPVPDNHDETPAKGLLNRELRITPEKVRELCEGASITPNTLFTGVFGIVAARFSNEREALFATIYNGRNDSRLTNTMCMLVKTLPVYTKFDASTRLTAYFSELQDQLMRSMANDIYPFSEISAKYGISSDLLFAYQAELTDDYPIGDTLARGEDLSLDRPKEPLLLQVRLRDGKYVLEAEYRADMYSEKMIAGILSAYDTAMSSAASAVRAADVAVLSGDIEREMDAWNDTDVEYDTSQTVISMIERSAAGYPDNTACVFEERSVTYRQMNEQADRIAAYLIEKGIGRGSVVSVLVPRHEIMLTASVGVLKTGAAYQPLDATYPGDRLSFMVEDSSAALLITTSGLRGKIEDYGGEVLLLDLGNEDGKPNEALPDAAKAKEILKAHREKNGNVRPSDLFTLLYTSGTTGKPKGVRLTHGNLVSFLEWYRRFYDLTPDCAVGAYASYGFDANMMDMYTPLSTGAACVIVPEELRLDIEGMSRYLKKNRVTHMFMTTQVARQFAETADPGCIKYLSGGEALAPMEPPKGCEFYNVYGPTECTIYSTVFRIDKKRTNNPIGKPLDNLRVYITDPDGHRLPPGAVGELLIAGPHVADGYLNRPDKTAEVFIDNPFANGNETYRPAYRSGDVVRFLQDGNIEFIGRRDGQVKIRGFRIELPEVEGVIREFAPVKNAAVAAFDNPGGGKYIAAYIVTKDGKDIDADALREHILASKPPYMVPEVIMTIDAIPLNQNGKVNKRALPAPVRTAERIVPPKTETQRKIFDCVAEAIGHREFGITTDIRYAGLTSITSIKLNVLLSKAFDVSVRSSDLKENPTVEQLERFLLHSEKITSHEKQEVYPLCSTQEGVFVDCMANAGSTVYNIPCLFRLSDKLDLMKVKQAVEQAVNAHPYLKVQLFMDKDGEIRQRRNDDEPFDVPVLSDLDRDALVRPFGLLNERLFRIELYRTYDGNYLFMDIHHLIADGSSLALLLSDISRAYAGETLAGESYTAYDLALDNAARKADGAFEKALAFYDETFSDAGKNTGIPYDKEDKKASVKTLANTIPGVDSKRVSEFCERYGITENAFFVAAFGLMLSRYHFSDKALFTTIYHGRNDAKLSDTVGMLVKTMPVSVRQNEDPAAFFGAVRDELMGLMDADIMTYSEAATRYGLSPDTMFVYQGDNFEFDTLCGEPAETIPLALNAAKEPVSVTVSKTPEGFVCEYEYRGDLYEEETIGFLADNYGITVNALLDGTAPTDLRLPFDEAEKMTELPKFVGKTFVDLFYETAEKYPDRLALKDEYSSMTYKELDAVTDYIAEKLAADGFGSEKAAGILCGRVKEFVVAVIGIMKAGGAYVPLDPDYPADRVLYMLTDSGSTHLFAQKELLPIAENYGGSLILLDDIVSEALGKRSGGRADLPRPKRSDLAYMIYTSGSTGKPKGVELTHGNLVNLLQQITSEQAPTENDMYAVFSSFCFDASVHDIFVPFTCGASLYIFPADSRQDVMKVCEVFEREPITVSTMPTQMGELAADMLSDNCRLRILTLGGEKFKRFHDKKGLKMYNGYGPTENTVSTSSFIVDRDHKNIPIGKSHINVRSYILNENLKRVPVGANGELCVAGRQVARGYHNLPEKTASVFVANPYALSPDEAVLYHTGDMVRKKGDGNMEYVGRIDSQIKIRGFRVELGEIEGALLRREGVHEAAVTAVETNGVMNLIAYHTGTEYAADDWKTFLEPLLPEYMLPSFFVHLDAMPVTPGGKIDKKALPKPEMNAGSNYVPPETTLQKKLCDIFAKALGAERVGIDDDFFTLGGSSLSASKVAVMCLAEKIEIVYADIFRHPTVRELSAGIGGGEATVSDDEFSAYDYSGIDSVLVQNVIQNVDKVKAGDIGDVLLTGATGFLGMHILREFLDNYSGKIVCLVRKRESETARKRLESMLVYYFDTNYAADFDSGRLTAVDGDITEEAEVMGFSQYRFDTVINCAACVKHFSESDLLERINVTGVKHLVKLCKEVNRKLIHISTVSVAGEGMDGIPPENRKIQERDLYFGQSITNEYIRTKFLSERIVLQAVSEGLDAKIMRVGNLMSRESDGEFQINFITNGFLRGLRGYRTLGVFPISAMGETAEFSPIDSTAQAVLTLAGTDKRFTLFHVTNSHRIFMSDVIRAMKKFGYDIEIVPDDVFEEKLNAYAKEHEQSESVSGLIAYASHDENRIYGIDYNNEFTVQSLYRLGFLWPITDDRYLENAIRALDELGFFEEV